MALASGDVLTRLLDARLDFGVVRASRIPAGLRTRPLGAVHYALYVPRALVPRGRADDAGALLAAVPIATQYGEPEQQERLEGALRRAGVVFAPALVCETFPQAQRAVRSGSFGAVLPTLARAELAARDFCEVQSPLFAKLSTNMAFAWHGRVERRRPEIAALVPRLVSALTFAPR